MLLYDAEYICLECVCGLCFVSLCAAVCLFSVRHLSHTVILPSSGPAYLTVIPSHFSLACCLISLSLSMLLSIMWVCPCSYRTLGPVWSFFMSNVGSAEPGCFPVCPIAQYDSWYTVVSVRVDRVVDQNQWLNSHLTRRWFQVQVHLLL